MTDDKIYFDYLTRLRDSGITNMWGAGAFVSKQFGVSNKEGNEILGRWMKTFETQDNSSSTYPASKQKGLNKK